VLSRPFRPEFKPLNGREILHGGTV
jgi:hypothetical protein